MIFTTFNFRCVLSYNVFQFEFLIQHAVDQFGSERFVCAFTAQQYVVEFDSGESAIAIDFVKTGICVQKCSVHILSKHRSDCNLASVGEVFGSHCLAALVLQMRNQQHTVAHFEINAFFVNLYDLPDLCGRTVD